MLLLIPTRDQAAAGFPVTCATLTELDPRWPLTLRPEMYTDGPNPHLNNAGHREFAAFALAQLSAWARIP